MIFVDGKPKDRGKALAILKARNKFVAQYAAEHGWSHDIGSWSTEQILELRRQEGWKNPKIIEEDETGF
jgi:hypothetical protein